MSAVELAGATAPAPLPAVAPAAPYELAHSPLWVCADEHSLWGRIVTDPREVEAIRARVAYYSPRRGGRR